MAGRGGGRRGPPALDGPGHRLGRAAAARPLHRDRGRLSSIALLGGSRVQVSGPTAAFVVILAPIAARFGLGGLLLATLIAGVILFVMGVARMGQFIEYVPYPVTTGFTAGIAVVIGTLQLKDFLGLAGGAHARALPRAAGRPAAARCPRSSRRDVADRRC